MNSAGVGKQVSTQNLAEAHFDFDQEKPQLILSHQ